MSILKRFVLNYNDRFMYQSSSKGNQKKWIYDNKFIKADTYNGYESIAECLAYIVGKHTNIKSIKYLSCIINEVNEYGVESFYGCYSNNFIKEGESLVTVYKILNCLCCALLCILIKNENKKTLRLGVYLFSIMNFISAIGYAPWLALIISFMLHITYSFPL